MAVGQLMTAAAACRAASLCAARQRNIVARHMYRDIGVQVLKEGKGIGHDALDCRACQANAPMGLDHLHLQAIATSLSVRMI